VQKITLELPIRSLIHALELVEAGVYPSVDDLVAAAIEAVRASPEVARNLRPEGQTSSFVQLPPRVRFILEEADFGDPPIVDAQSTTILPHPLLPITISRFFAAKPILRLLARSLANANQEYLRTADFRDLLRHKAFSWTDSLRRLDLEGDRPKGERLSTTFPTVDREEGKSMVRFLEAYVGSAYAGTPRVGGLLPFLGFVSLVGRGGEERIGITAFGLDFARSPNPVLDEAEPAFPPFRNEEVALLLSAIRRRSPDEWQHIQYYVRTIAGAGSASRNMLVQRMRSFYVRFWSPLALSKGMVESLTATVHSRCQELGFVRTRREGRISSYAVTEVGSRWLATEVPEEGGGGST